MRFFALLLICLSISQINSYEYFPQVPYHQQFQYKYVASYYQGQIQESQQTIAKLYEMIHHLVVGYKHIQSTNQQLYKLVTDILSHEAQKLLNESIEKDKQLEVPKKSEVETIEKDCDHSEQKIQEIPITNAMVIEIQPVEEEIKSEEKKSLSEQ